MVKKQTKQTIIDKATAFIHKHHLINDGDTIIIGLSGGPDSVFLLHLLAQLQKSKQLTLIAAHLDHEWRTNSANDVTFCSNIAQDLDIPFTHTTLSKLDRTFKGSKEEVGRKARRYYFEQLVKKYHAHSIALGHHLQDQEETFFIRLIRGTTLAGLTCMKPKDGLYIRPLLEIKKTAIINYLDEQAIPYLIDPSNEQEAFLRNRIRKHVIPALQKCDERFDHNFLRTLVNLQQANTYLDTITQKTFDAISTTKDGAISIDIKKLFEYDEYMQNRVILHWLILHNVLFTPTKLFLAEIKRFLIQPGSKTHNMHETWHIIKIKNIASIKKI